MPIENESFYNLLGEEISRESIVDRMIEYYIEKLEIGETKITDFNEGSEIRNLLEAFAVDLYDLMEDNYEATKIAFISTAYGEWLDLHGENPLINLPRDNGQEAEGFVTFSIPDLRETDLIIPEETILVCEENDLEYVTDSEAIIVAGDTEVEVFCTCLTVGEDGNCSANTITIIDDDNIDDTIEITNKEAFSEGTDYEEDDDYRERLLSSIRLDNFGSIGYYQDLGEKVDGVHDVLLVPDENYTRKILVNGDTKPVTNEVLMSVLQEFTKPENIVLGHSFIVEAPEYLLVNLKVDLSVEYELDNEIIETRLNNFFNGAITDDGFDFAGLYIGENINESFFYSALESLDGVLRAEVKVKGTTILNINEENDNPLSGGVFEPFDENYSELSSINVKNNQVLKLKDITINQTLVE